MRRWLLAGYLGLTAFVLVILVIPLGIVSARSERDRLITAVERDATVMAGLAEDALDQGAPADLTQTVASYEQRTGGRVVIVDRDGTSVADSDLNPGRDYSTRPELRTALTGRVATGARFSQTLNERLAYVAVPVASGGRVHGAVRVTFPTAALDARINRTWLMLGLVSIVVLAAATLISVLLARMMSTPVVRLTEGTRRMADGDTDVRVEPGGPAELRRLAQSFNVMSARLDHLLASQESFVADASHQLRSPLAALRLRLENLEAETGDAAVAELAGAITETMRLSRLVDGLLALTRAGYEGPAAQSVDLAAVVADRRRTWAPLADEQGVTIVTHEEPVTIHVPDGVADQILDNLIVNALSVVPPQTTVTLRVTHDGHEAVLHVVDEGPGMAAEERARAFDRFWRGSRSRGVTGFGLGLAIVRRLVETTGGAIALLEATGGGLDVMIRWPAEEGSSRASRAGLGHVASGT